MFGYILKLAQRHHHESRAKVMSQSRKQAILEGVERQRRRNRLNKPIHTHDTSGTLHIETDENRQYFLHDFFLIWGNQENNPERAVFNSTQLFGGHVVTGQHSLTMTVNDASNSDFQNFAIPKNSQTASDVCSQTPCVTTNVVITYT